MAAPLLSVQLRDYQEPAPVLFPYIFCPLGIPAQQSHFTEHWGIH
jgi:hypothetical protein